MLSERSQTQKGIYCMIPFIQHSGKDKTVGTVISQRWPGTEEVGRELPGKGEEGNFGGNGNVLYHDCDIVTGQYMFVSSLNCTLKKVKWITCKL